ncbi:hypothetical protein [Dehalogenimonas sp. 4OHTPN]|uniref:Uncharacterized protein n=1 Tax=Dehalogenimonas sp. 4OHTPN TaxID=3166643 RepID=A0AAU8GAC6_9CHLR
MVLTQYSLGFFEIWRRITVEDDVEVIREELVVGFVTVFEFPGHVISQDGKDQFDQIHVAENQGIFELPRFSRQPV